ncbi:MAG: autotransporter-associated beta strand repeat-containing protein [Verrucomicrobiota bacterium]
MLLELRFITVTAVIAACCSTLAGTIDKTNNADALNLGSSWVGGAIPSAADIAQWSATVMGPNTVELGADASWSGVKLSNPGGAVTLNSGNTLTLGTAGVDLSAATQDLTLNCGLAFGANQIWTVNSGRALTAAGALATTSSTLTKSGLGIVTLSGGGTLSSTLTVNAGKVSIQGGTWSLGGSGDLHQLQIAGGATFEIVGGNVTLPFYAEVSKSGSGGGLMRVSGGNVIENGEFMIGRTSSGTLIVTNTAALTLNQLKIGDLSAANTGTVNLDGGTTTVSFVATRNSASTSILNFNGGTLRAKSAQSAFVNGLTSARVRAGGAVIDSQGFNLTMPQSLLHDPGLGAGSDGGLIKLGSGALTLTGTNTYDGPTAISNGTLNVNGRVDGAGAVTVYSGATLGGTGVVAGAVSVLDNAILAPGTGRLILGDLELSAASTLQLTLAAAGSSANSKLQVNGNVNLNGQLMVSDAGGIASNSVYTALTYTGTLTDLGLTVSPLSQWDVTIDTNTPGEVRLVTARKFPFVEIAEGNLVVRSLSTNLTGIIHGTPGYNYAWYEVRSNSLTGRLIDWGAQVATTSCPFTVRNLQAGTNYVVFFAMDSSRQVVSNWVTLTLTLDANTPVRPRPIPAEIWWGGLSTNNPALVAPGAEWDFVKRYQDGFFFHTAYGANFSTSDKLALAAALRPFNTKYCCELGGGCTPAPSWAYGQAGRNSGWGKSLEENYQALGIVMSDVTHDYHPENLEDFCQAYPSWPQNDILAYFTGDLTLASPGYSFPSGQWKDAFYIYSTNNPHLKIGLTSSPVWWPWGNYPALAANHLAYTPLRDTNNTPIQVNGTNVSFSFNMSDIQNAHINATYSLGMEYFAFATDCPWDYFGAWGNVTDRTNNRAKIRAYEQFLQNRGARHTFICNVSNAAGQPGGNDAQDNYYKQSSLNSLFTHQQEGGRANRYLFESWYQGIPHAAVPETKSGSYANLAMEAIKYLKGIRDTNGALEELSLTLLSSGMTNVIELRNDGDVACLPAVIAFDSGGAGTVNYFDAAGSNITARILSAEGYVYTNRLSPGQTTTLRVVTSVQPLNRTITLEAFWNPQDPTGIVRDRLLLTPPNQPPVLTAISNQTLIAGQTLLLTNAATDPDVPAQTLTWNLLSPPAGATVNSSNGLFSWRPTLAQAPIVTSIGIRVADNGSPSLSATQRFWVTVNRPIQPALSAVGISSCQFQFLISGDAGPDYTVEASTNLSQWFPLWVTNSPSLPFLFSSPSSASQPHQFYRVLMGP